MPYYKTLDIPSKIILKTPLFFFFEIGENLSSLLNLTKNILALS